MEKEMVTITKKEYDELLDSQFWLNCLENAGVDNWKGYDDARGEYLEFNRDA